MIQMKKKNKQSKVSRNEQEAESRVYLGIL